MRTDQPASSVIVTAGIVGGARPTLTEWRDLLLASFYDQSQGEIHLAVSPDAGMTWKAGPIAGIQDANGWHDIAVADGVLHLFYAAGTQGILMHAFLDVSGDHFAATDVAVIDDGAVSKGGANMSHWTLGSELLLVYNGAYDIPGQGKTLKLLRMDASDDNPRIEEVDGPACSVGNHAALVASDNLLAILSVDKSGPQLYVLQGQVDEPFGKISLGDFENHGPFSASNLWLSDDSFVAYLQQWPRIIGIAIDPPVSTASPVELFVGKRADDECPGSDLEVVEVDGSRLVFFFDPAERRIRALRDFELAAE